MIKGFDKLINLDKQIAKEVKRAELSKLYKKWEEEGRPSTFAEFWHSETGHSYSSDHFADLIDFINNILLKQE